MSRHAPLRDRTPPRSYDRRPSTTAFPSTGSSYRGVADTSQSPLDRPPPRGPKADGFRGGFQSSAFGRGRGAPPFSARPGDSWDRGDRDRDRNDRAPPPPYRARDDDRSDAWRRDRDQGPADRPLGLPRDSRPFGPRDRSASPARARRGSRESLPALSTRPSDSITPHYGPAIRGGIGRGHSRGEWDRRGRSSFAADRDRDLFPTRSRSRDAWRERDYERPRHTVEPDRFDRRDRERSRDRDFRPRDHDIWQRDHSPVRSLGGQPPVRGPSPAASSSASLAQHGGADHASKPDHDMSRRTPSILTPGGLNRESRRDGDFPDYFGSRNDPPRRDQVQSLPYQHQSAQASSTSGGLDYGPPPAVTNANVSVPDKTTQPKPVLSKPESSANSSQTFHPPSGPKAERNLASGTGAQLNRPTPQSDAPAKAEPSKPRQAPGLGLVASTEPSPKVTDGRGESRPSHIQIPDKLPANVPLGPRSAMSSGFKQRMPSSEPTASNLGPSKPTMDRSNVPIPTGPRSERDPAWQPAGVANRSWISPEYGRVKPSIMTPLNRDRPAFAPTGPRSQTILPPHSDKPRMFQHTAPSGAGSLAASGTSVKKTVPGEGRGVARGAGTRPTGTADVEMSLPASSDDEGDEDEFDEDDFAASEEKYVIERKAIEARKPLPLLQDYGVRALLVKIQLLNMILHDVIPQSKSEDIFMDDAAKPAELPQIGLPSPDQVADEREERPEMQHPQPRGRPLSQRPINPIPTPPVEDLPYLKSGIVAPTVFEDSDDEIQQEAIATLIRQEFESAAFEWQNEIDDMRLEYKRRYLPWKQEAIYLEQRERELQHVSPAPASPAPSAAPSVTPSLGHERTRGARNTTEADLQAAILMSQQSAREEEERREREAASNSMPNYETEAVVPPMLKPMEAELDMFEDTNKLIPTELALEVFAYVPPEDDFTEQEQVDFIAAYCQTPKKWGKIAEALPRRSYQDCITHYYLTKNVANYKEIFRRSQPKRKRGRAAAMKPRSNALMSELQVYGDDGEGNVAVTDTGRPRRAAAPTFGDNGGESELATPAPQAKRPAIGAKDATTDTPAAKPGRGRKAGANPKPRRTKAQIQADQQATQAALHLAPHPTEASPQKAFLGHQRERARNLLRPDEGGLKTDLAPGPELSRLMDVDVPQYALTDTDRYPANAAANQPTSYWSVPEQQKFPQLIAYHGRDFAAIADFMKTKTVTMIKNHYNRQIADGKTELEELAKVAERRKANQEPLGPPPSPAAQTKRRYEATPSTASAIRPTTTPAEHGLAEAERNALQPKTGYTEDFPSNAVQRSATGDLVAKPRQGRDLFRDPPTGIAHPPKIEESPRPGIFTQKFLSGPRAGLFTDEPASFGLPHHGLHGLVHEHSPRQHPIRSTELRASDLLGSRVAGSPQQIPLVHLRDPAVTTSQNAPQIFGQLQPQAEKHGSFGFQQAHSRNSSLGMGNAALEQPRDLASLRRFDPNHRDMPLAPGRTQSPASSHVQPVGFMRRDNPPTPSLAPADQPKPAPVKRSNIMNILNDEAPDPQPVKRSSLESQNRPSILSPQPGPISAQTGPYEQRRNEVRQEDAHAALNRNMRNHFSHIGGLSGTPQSARDHLNGYSSSPAQSQIDSWMDHFDPRLKGAPTEQRSLHQSPRTGAYSVLPTSSQTTDVPSLPSFRMESQRSIDANMPDRHRSLLGQMNHPGNNPSPPPAPTVPFRSLSGSSQHSRMSSLGFQSSQSQPQSHVQQMMQQPAPASHPQSTSSTPVSALHHQHQSRSSLAYQSTRLTIQQVKAQEQQQHLQMQSHEREFEQAHKRQRELEAQQQQMRAPPDREREPPFHRRDVYGPDTRPPNPTPPPQHHSQHHQQQHQSQPQPHHNHQQHQQHQSIMPSPANGMPGQRHPGFSQDPLQRTYTPPGGPYGGSALGGPPGHGHHHHHHHHGGPGQEMRQDLRQDPRQGSQPGPPPGQHGQPGHFRGMSERDERR